MKQIMDNKLTLKSFKLALVASLGVLSGCLVTVSHFDGGAVTSDLGADCQFNCIYQLNEGESLNRVFTATPLPGNDFIRWSDSLGSNTQLCAQTTLRECNLIIADLHPLFEGLELNVEAQFRAVSGYGVNAIGFTDTMTTAQGTFKQIDAITWVEAYPNALPTNYYNTEIRTLSRLVLYDRFADVRYFFDFSTGSIQQQIGMGPITAWGSIQGRSAVTSGWLAARVRAGNAGGNYKGDYIQTDDNTWVYRKRGKAKNKFTFVETGRDDATVSLRDDSRNVDIVLNLLEGVIYSSKASAPLRTAGLVQNSAPAATGFTVSEVSYGSGSKDIDGYFLERGSNRWLQTQADGKTETAVFELSRRSAIEVELLSLEGDVRVNINLSTGEINLLSVPVPLPIESFDLVDAQ